MENPVLLLASVKIVDRTCHFSKTRLIVRMILHYAKSILPLEQIVRILFCLELIAVYAQKR